MNGGREMIFGQKKKGIIKGDVWHSRHHFTELSMPIIISVSVSLAIESRFLFIVPIFSSQAVLISVCLLHAELCEGFFVMY